MRIEIAIQNNAWPDKVARAVTDVPDAEMQFAPDRQQLLERAMLILCRKFSQRLKADGKLDYGVLSMEPVNKLKGPGKN